MKRMGKRSATSAEFRCVACRHSPLAPSIETTASLDPKQVLMHEVQPRFLQYPRRRHLDSLPVRKQESLDMMICHVCKYAAHAR